MAPGRRRARRRYASFGQAGSKPRGRVWRNSVLPSVGSGRNSRSSRRPARTTSSTPRARVVSVTPDDDAHPSPEELATRQEKLAQEGIQLLFERDVFGRRVSQRIEALQIGQGTLLAQPRFFHGLIHHGDIDHDG